jgi:hypothetical protein
VIPISVEKERGVQTFYRRRSTATGLIRMNRATPSTIENRLEKHISRTHRDRLERYQAPSQVEQE